ncbi:hypothetical protein TVAG_079740 [Trichomonas vaginalis G3]|uniref:Uncharacterized protein n=1 Tax=Trichomonas vaginalis (strain ATCC PRA-98 / G3) TaxID=412133 RepID=A2EFA4_TRIV3|nr:hypothetical protein TVAGG3_1030640 [Trichomonas vaginalis G3]EAY08714.1 hypothetical protein TVAG_079740 [Trichomonas vaginalis G3]KAI5492841.1 hypothetical protein TVAGG3_1030640 [Trichomonas vaginalis G3]|eukprot:XP_001320937.1 hypothetical protein [Trichomonas vaginalis G3]
MIEEENIQFQKDKISHSKPIRRIPRNVQTFGPKVKSASQANKFNFQHVVYALKSISEGRDILSSIKTVSDRINDLNESDLEKIETMIPYNVLLDVIVSMGDSADSSPKPGNFTPILIILSKFAGNDSFPANLFIDEKILQLILSVISNAEGLDNRDYAFKIFNTLVRIDVSVRDFLIANGIKTILYTESLPPSGIDLLFAFAFTQPYLEKNTIRQIYFTLLNIIQGGKSKSVLRILEYLQEDLPAVEGFAFEFAEYILIRIENKYEYKIVRKVFDVKGKLEIPDETCYMFLLNSLKSNIEKPSTHELQSFLIWGFSTLVSFISNFDLDSLKQISEFFFEKFAKFSYKIQVVVVKAFCLMDSSCLDDSRCVDALVQFSVDETIGAHCMMKLVSIIKRGSEISEYAAEKCHEIDDSINDMMTNEDPEKSNAAATLSITLEEMQK